MRLIYLGDQWDERERRRQQLAKALAVSGMFDEICYVETSLSGVSLIKFVLGIADSDARDRWSRIWKKGRTFRASGVKVVTPFMLRPFGHALKKAGVKSLLSDFSKIGIGGVPSVLWVSHPRWGGCSTQMDSEVRVYDRSEDFAAMEGADSKIGSELMAADLRLIRSSNLVLVQTPEHQDFAGKYNENVHCVPNGVDTAMFEGSENRAIPAELRDLPRPLLGYVGSVAGRIDWSLIRRLSREFLKATIVFVGRADGAPNDVQRLGNVRFLGERGYRQLPDYLTAFDIGLIPYHPQKFYGSPTKLFDYLAAGLPIVATDFAGTREYADWVLVADGEEQFVRHVRQALDSTGSADSINRKAAAESFSWVNRAEYVKRLLNRELQSRQRSGKVPFMAGGR